MVVGDNHNRLGITIKRKIFANYYLLITLFFAAEPLSPISTTPPDLPCRRGGVLWVVLPNAWQIIYYLLITL